MIQQLEEYAGSMDEEAAESLSIACQCLGEAFSVDTEDQEQVKQLSIRPVTLEQAFRVGHAKINQALAEKKEGKEAEQDPKFVEFLKHLEEKNFFAGVEKGSENWEKRMDMARQGYEKQFGKVGSSNSNSEGQETEEGSEDDQPLHSGLSEDELIAKANEYKGLGNKALGDKDYETAIGYYTNAIRTYSNNAIYFSNRAAARTMLGDNEGAVKDCRSAIKVDPSYAKAYSRLGLALYNLGRYQEAIDEAYGPGLEVDSGMQSLIEGKADCEKALTPQQPFGGNGGLNLDPSVLAGNPQLANLMSNPAIASMAQQVMSDPATMQNMMNMFGGGAGGGFPAGMMGGQGQGQGQQAQEEVEEEAEVESTPQPQMPEGLDALMNNPQLAAMAQQAMANPEMMNMMASMMGGMPQNQ
eukprot:TRINITY_DN2021_c1_g3_i1.p1 TRINITY_DN2021_c1_g3~~TRINITY_DN2021_c1_g3_i1.p1  ORF type:complete len:412 (+),score=159.71 TRINITY_DN2021_c1_g3_i1:281-1516(+)